MFAQSTIIEPTISTTLALVTKAPPTEATFEILFIPFDDRNVITIIKHIPRIPSVCAEFRPNNDQVDVLSAPNIRFDRGTHIEDDTLTIHTI